MAAGAEGNPNSKEWTDAQRIQVTAQVLYGYGYWGPFLLEFEEKTLDCGVEDLGWRPAGALYLGYRPVTQLFAAQLAP